MGSLIRALIPSWGLHPYDLVTSQRPCLSTPSYWALGFQHVNSGDTNIEIQQRARGGDKGLVMPNCL